MASAPEILGAGIGRDVEGTGVTFRNCGYTKGVFRRATKVEELGGRVVGVGAARQCCDSALLGIDEGGEARKSGEVLSACGGVAATHGVRGLGPG